MSEVSPGHLGLHLNNLYSIFYLQFLLFTMKSMVESALSTYYVPSTMIALGMLFWTVSALRA